MHVETSGNMHDATSYAAIGQTAGATSLGIGAGQNFVLQARPTPELSIVGQWWRIVKRRKWIIVSSIVAGILFGLLVNLMSQRLYTAISTVEIARDSARVLNEDVVSREITTADQEFYQTQYGLLKSRSLAERVVQSMRLSRDPAFRRAFGLDARGLSASPSAAIPGARRTAAGAELEYIRGILLSQC